MTTVYRYDPESLNMVPVVVEGGNGGNGEYRTWMGIPDDIVATLLRYAKENGVSLGDGADTGRAAAAAKGKALKLYILAATRDYIVRRDAMAKAKAEVEAKAEVKAEAGKPAEKPAVQPQSQPQGRPRQVQLVK